jgi:hypothetical protein
MHQTHSSPLNANQFKTEDLKDPPCLWSGRAETIIWKCTQFFLHPKAYHPASLKHRLTLTVGCESFPASASEPNLDYKSDFKIKETAGNFSIEKQQR